MGYVIPPPVIQHFIEDYAKNGCFTAFPSLGIEWQKLENPQMRRALGLKVQPPSPALPGVCGALSESVKYLPYLRADAR